MIALIAVVAVVHHAYWLHWVSHFFGFDNLSGPFYGFWSGAGSDIAELAILGGLISMARNHNCHVKGCWKLSAHPVEGTPYKVCRKHHPTVPEEITVQHILDAHAAATKKPPRAKPAVTLTK